MWADHRAGVEDGGPRQLRLLVARQEASDVDHHVDEQATSANTEAITVCAHTALLGTLCLFTLAIAEGSF